MKAKNKTLLNSLKKGLEWAKGKWVDKLLGILWAYWMTSRKPTGVTPFDLAYGMEVIISIEIRMPTTRTVIQGVRDNNVDIKRHLDWGYEEWKETTIWIALYH